MKKILFIFLVLCGACLNAQDMCLNWAVRSGSTSVDEGVGIAYDASGNVITCGQFYNTVDFDPTAGVSNLTSAGFSDVFISKLSSTGAFVWAKRIGNAGDEITAGICVDPSGNVYVIGSFTGTVDFDPGASTFNLTSAGGRDLFILKLNSLGNFVWAKRVGGASSDAPQSITLDNVGNVYTTGYFIGASVDFDPSATTFNLIGSSFGSCFVLKLDASGNFVWARAFAGATKDCFGKCIKTDIATGEVFVVGYYGGTVDFDPGAATFPYTSVSPNYDGFLCKLDPSGNFIFAKSFGGAGNTIVNTMEIQSSGNLYLAGNYSGATDLDPGPGTFTFNTATSLDAYILKLDATGNFLWANSIGTSGFADDAKDITINSNGVVYLFGTFNNTVDFDPGPLTNTVTSAGADDIYISIYDPSGNLVFVRTIGGTSVDVVLSAEMDANDVLYITGYFYSVVDFNPGIGVTNLSSAGTNDVFIERLSIIASPTITATGPTAFCSGGSVTLTSSSASTYTWNSSANTQTISASTSSNYFVTVSTTACAVSSNVIPVIVNPLPTVTVSSGAICFGDSYTITPSGASTYTFSNGPIVSPTSLTSYSVIGTSTAGCISSNTAISTVTVNPLPIITVNSGSICSGNSFTIIPAGASVYTLSAGPVVSPTITTTYSVIGTSTDGCVSSTSAICNITVNALPLPTVSVNSGTVCSGASYFINTSGAYTYSYSTGTNTIYPTVNTTYSVYGTDNYGCISASAAVGNVTVVSNPIITINSGTLCPGQIFTMTPSGAISYTFSNNSATVNPITNSSYTVYGTNSIGCIGLAASNITVLPTPTPNVNSGLICYGKTFTLNPSGGVSYTVTPGGSTIVSPTSSTTYTVICSNSFGCVSLGSAIANVNVLTLPALSVNSGTICFGKTFTISPVSAFNYTIVGATNTVSPNFNTSYIVITTDQFGCTNTVTSNVTVLPPPNMYISSSENPMCIGKSATLTAISSAITHTWSTSSNGTTEIVSPFVPTTYSIIGTDVNGCTNSFAMTQTVDFCSGLEEYTNQNIVIGKIYPNPSSGNINLELNGKTDMFVFNVLGKIIYSQQTENKLTQISLADMPKGVYFIVLKNTSTTQTIKIILE